MHAAIGSKRGHNGSFDVHELPISAAVGSTLQNSTTQLLKINACELNFRNGVVIKKDVN